MSLKLLVNKLREEDKVSIVVYAGSAGLVLPPTSGSDKETIYASLDRLQAGGSTAGGAGIELAYKTANENFMRGGNNRVILATDGDFNVGASGDNELEDLIVKQRNKGVYLTCLGYGMGNYKDSKMEVLTDKGNGNYAYIDNVQEANKTLVKEFGGTIFTVAKDVKAQIEFNPKYVKSYRLVGYENRVLNAEDFKDDKKDAGEMGSGHTVTILYEIVPANNNDEAGDDLKYQQSAVTGSSEFATIKFRYKRPNADKSKEMVHIISPNIKRIDLASDNVRFASSVAMFGMLLKDSKYKGVGTYDMALALARSAKGKDKEGYRAEYIKMVKTMNNDKSVDSEDNSGLGWNGVD
jgi:Ca-activated chloride channel family protein